MKRAQEGFGWGFVTLCTSLIAGVGILPVLRDPQPVAVLATSALVLVAVYAAIKADHGSSQ